MPVATVLRFGVVLDTHLRSGGREMTNSQLVVTITFLEVSDANDGTYKPNTVSDNSRRFYNDLRRGRYVICYSATCDRRAIVKCKHRYIYLKISLKTG